MPISKSFAFILFSLIIWPAQSKTITSTITQTVPAASSPTKISSSHTSDSEFRSTILNSTNFYRAQHNATVLKWNETLASYAAAYASPFGETLAEGYPNTTSAVEAWGNERRRYDFNRPTGFSQATGHFTQLVWKATRSVGCARFDCDGGGSGGGSGDEGGGRGGGEGGRRGDDAFGWMVVCKYYPAGNVETQYTAQVQKQIKGGRGRAKDSNSNGAGTNKQSAAGGVVTMVLFAVAGMMSLEDWLW